MDRPAGFTSGGGESSQSALAERIYRLLNTVHDPCSVAMSTPMGLSEMGIVKSVDVSADGHVDVELRLTSPFCEMIGYMQNEAIRRISELSGVTGVSVYPDSGLDWGHSMMSPSAQARRQERLKALHALPMAEAPPA